MGTQYTIVQFVPDPIADERLNVGLIAWHGNEVYADFLRDWRRVQKLAGKDVTTVREFARDFSYEVTGQMQLSKDHSITPELIRDIQQDWKHQIQFSDIRGSLENDPRELINKLRDYFLHEPSMPKRAKNIGRLQAAHTAYQIALDAATERAPERATQYVRRNVAIEGRHETHQFDIAFANGNVIAGIDALSFQVAPETAENQFNRIVTNLHDIRAEHPQLSLAVYVVPPRKWSAMYDNKIEYIQDFEATVLKDSNLRDWASEQVGRILR